jgi:serine/threonine protein kinase
MEVGVELLRGKAAIAFQEVAELIYETRKSHSEEVKKYASGALGRELRAIAAALSDWSESEATAVVAALKSRSQEIVRHSRVDLDLAQVPDWLDRHRSAARREDRSGGVIDCIRLHPPEDVRVVRRLAHAGSQKVVYEGTWRIGERDVPIALKQFREAARGAFTRELLTHPLSLSHPNIVRTYALRNRESPAEDFLVESWLRRVLSDNWVAEGLHEAARLLVDLARALTFLHDLGLIHGDVKPDNIGVDSGRYILLDFGIARPRARFTGDVTPTGSLRTRAPELLTGTGLHAEKSDVWAMGATVFMTLVGRYPLFHRTGDDVPKAVGSKGAKAREALAEELRRRVDHDWETLLAPVLDPAAADSIEARFLCEHDRFRRLLASTLAREPRDRPTALEVLHEALGALPSLVGESMGRVFAPDEELRQLDRYLGNDKELALLPDRKREELLDRLGELEESLRAQRHSRALAQELLERYGDELPRSKNLAMAERERISELIVLIRDFKGTNRDIEEERVLDRVRIRLDVSVRTEDERYTTFLTELEDRLRTIVSSEELAGYDRGEFVRRADEFRQSLGESA